jgi:sugar phosphate isomerase/epimerase
MAFNAERLAPVFDDIELVFFQSANVCNFPDHGVIALLRQLSEKYGTTYTVHFPIDKKAGASGKPERDDFIEQVERLMELTQPLKPFGYILHLEGICRHSSGADKKRWLECAYQSCGRIASIPGLDASRICVENLDYPSAWHEKMAATFGFSLCCDLGHMFLYKENIEKTVPDLLPRVRVIHLHGVFDGKDHVSLAKHDRAQLAPVIRDILPFFSGVVTLETFNDPDTSGSVETIKQLWRK